MYRLFEVRLKILSGHKKLTIGVRCLSILTFQDFQHSVIDESCFKQMHIDRTVPNQNFSKKLKNLCLLPNIPTLGGYLTRQFVKMAMCSMEWCQVHG